MLGQIVAALAMLVGTSAATWQDDGTVRIDITFDAKDPMNPFPQGDKLLLQQAKQACGKKGQPQQIGETVLTGISLAGTTAQVSMSGTYACG
jgi:hypothetical protein